MAGGSASLGTITGAGLYAAPLSGQSVTITATSAADSTKSGNVAVTMLAPHAIAIRAVTGANAEFYFRSTNATFTPRGNNYIRLAPQTWPDGSVGIYHSTFNPASYDAAQTLAALQNMQANGYNVVRVFVNGCCHDNSLGDPSGGLSQPYIANLVDFLAKAQSTGIEVILTIDSVPGFGGYTDHFAPCTDFGNFNTQNLCSGGIDAMTSFFHDFVQALVTNQAALSAVLAYEVRNEYFYDSALAPLTWTSGSVTTANGETYDMSRLCVASSNDG